MYKYTGRNNNDDNKQQQQHTTTTTTTTTTYLQASKLYLAAIRAIIVIKLIIRSVFCCWLIEQLFD